MKLWTDQYELKISQVDEIVEHGHASMREHNEQFPDHIATHWPFSFGKLEFEYNELMNAYNNLLQKAKAGAQHVEELEHERDCRKG